jgi:hypothetical protein
MMRSVVQHTISHPRAALREVNELTVIDTTDETVKLGAAIPLVVINGLRDRICSARQSRNKLEAANLPAEQLIDLDMSHLSALLRPSHIRAVLASQPALSGAQRRPAA